MTKIPERIGKYEVIRRLGYGGMGTVFLARDPQLDRLLAIKVLRDLMFDEQMIQRFLREARAAGNLRHDNIITVYDAGEHDHQPFMAMEYVDGVSFAEIIRARQPLGLADKVSYLEQVCAGLHYAHSRGIVHRDVKPANLMVDRRQTVRILDFGIARVEGSGMTRDGSLIGTLNYMSPEQMLGRQVDHRSDIFAFGAVAYELIAYERAFPGSIDDGLLHRVPNEQPRALSEVCPGLPPDLEPLVMRALAKKPEERFADLEEARAAFRQIRRQLDPQVDVEPISGAKTFGLRGVATPTPGQAPSTERQEFLERRARQVAYHRDAARSALKANDLDAAAAACEDALTLDPDDREALQLLTEIEQAREQRGLETKERHQRAGIVRRHIANADTKLAKGDAAGAAELLRQALALDPQNETARALLARTGEPVPPPPVAPTVVRPLGRPKTGSDAGSGRNAGIDTPLPTPASGAFGPASGAAAPAAPPSAARASVSRTPSAVADPTAASVAAAESTAGHGVAVGTTSSTRRFVVVGAVAAAAILALVLWMRPGGDTPADVTASVENTGSPPAPVEEPAATSPAPAPAPAPVPPPDDAAAGAATAAPPVTAAPAPAPAARTEPAAPVRPQPQPTVPPAARGGATPAPSPSPPAESAPARTTVVPIDLGPVDKALAAGDLTGALSQLEGLPNQTDERVRAAARRIAERSMDDMAAAETRASVFKANELAAGPFATASAQKTRADRAFEREDYPQAVRQALAAAAGFRTAADDARSADEARKKASEVAAAAAAAKKVPELDRAGILSALQRFQAAYQKRDVAAIRTIFPSYPQREFKRRFSDCRDLNVSFSGIAPAAVADDPGAAIVTLRSTYFCQPRINAPALEATQEDFFRLRKLGDTWLIERSGAFDALQ